MKSLADDAVNVAASTDETDGPAESAEGGFEGNLRATGQSRIEKALQVPEVSELVECFSCETERAGFAFAFALRATADE